MLQSTPVGNEEIADWIELSLLCRDSKIIRFSEFEKLSELHSLGDAEIAYGATVLSRRNDLLGETYPFKVEGQSIRITKSPVESGYVFCLLNSLTQNLIPWDAKFDFVSGAELFEEFALESIQNWLGSGASGVNFGWPSRYGRPQEFHHAIDWLAKQLGVEPGKGFRPPRRKDGGVDVVVWRRFPDKKPGFPIYLAQCTLQQDFLSKARDIDLRLWSGWLTLERDPETILAIPRTIPVGPQWAELTANNLLFERIRLASSFGLNRVSQEQSEFIGKQISKLRAAKDG